MAKIPIYVWTCDGNNCNTKFESMDEMSRYMDIPPGWAEISITQLNEEEEECLCKCHEDEVDDDGDNVAGHEDYECEVCPDEDDWEMSSTLCPACYAKFKMQWSLPRRANGG